MSNEDLRALLGEEKYVKKPIPIRAVKIEHEFTVDTLEGTLTGNAGDYLMEGIEDELYPCAASVFEKSYMPAP